jgi:hypothetical protein
MFFGKKNKKEIRCESCDKKVEDKFSYCPYCGESMISEEDEAEDYGLLGKNDRVDEEIGLADNQLGITDKLIGSIMDSMMRNLNKQLRGLDKEAGRTEVTTLPNGVKIRIATSPLAPQPRKAQPAKSPPKKDLTEDQMDRMSRLPRAQAKSSVKRFANKIVYELATPGVTNVNDVLVSKLESGYEIKAIGEKKVYANSIPLNLPLKQITLEKSKLFVEFLPNEQ